MEWHEAHIIAKSASAKEFLSPIMLFREGCRRNLAAAAARRDAYAIGFLLVGGWLTLPVGRRGSSSLSRAGPAACSWRAGRRLRGAVGLESVRPELLKLLALRRRQNVTHRELIINRRLFRCHLRRADFLHLRINCGAIRIVRGQQFI
jgi:hypothetical protein